MTPKYPSHYLCWKGKIFSFRHCIAMGHLSSHNIITCISHVLICYNYRPTCANPNNPQDDKIGDLLTKDEHHFIVYKVLGLVMLREHKFEVCPCKAYWTLASRSQRERQGVTLGETFRQAGGDPKESFKDNNVDDTNVHKTMANIIVNSFV